MSVFIVFTLAVLFCVSVNLPSFVINECVSKNSHSACSHALGVGRRVSLTGTISKVPYPRQQFHGAIIDARVCSLIVWTKDLSAKVPSCFRGWKKADVMCDYDGPLKMLQSKTCISMLALCGKDGGSQNGMSTEYWSINDNNNQKLQVRKKLEYFHQFFHCLLCIFW